MEEGYVISGKKCATLKKIYGRILFGNILGWIVYVLGAFADSIIGGYSIGEDALAAIEIIAPLSTLIYCVSYLVSTGNALLHAKYIGKNDFEAADRMYSSGFYFSVISGVILALIFALIKEPWLDLYGLEGSIRTHASDYYDPFVFVALITPLGTHLYNSIVCDGDCVYSVISDVAQAVLNLTLSFILVNSLGTFGLSISTLISVAVGFVIPVIRLFTKANTLHLKWAFSFKYLGKSIVVGMGTFLSTLAVAIIDIIMNMFITKRYGANFTAPYAVVNFALEIAGALSLVGQTMNTIMNFSIGENNNKDVKDILSLSKKVGVFTGLGFSAVFMGLTPFWPILFGLETQEFINYANVASISIGITFLPSAFLYLISSFYIGYEKIEISIIAYLLNSFIYPLICPIVLALIFDYNGFVIGFALSNVLSFVTLLLYLYIKNNKVVFKIPSSDSSFYSIDLTLDKECISKAVLQIRDILSYNNIDPIISTRVQLSIDEALNITLNNNPHKKVSSRVVLDINKDRVKIIEKDTGSINNLVNPDQAINNLSNYVFVMVNNKASKVVNYVASALNGNHLEFALNENKND